MHRRLIAFERDHVIRFVFTNRPHDFLLTAGRINRDYASFEIQQFQKIWNRGDLTGFLFSFDLAYDHFAFFGECAYDAWLFSGFSPRPP